MKPEIYERIENERKSGAFIESSNLKISCENGLGGEKKDNASK
jgi:hypothetical protein